MININNKNKILIFIPAYNVEKKIYSVVERIPNSIFDSDLIDILIINDNSNDNTSLEIEKIKKNFKYNFVTILFFLIPLTILITGERTSFIMFIFCIFISLFFFSFLLKKIKLFLISSIILASLLFSIIHLSSDVKHRYGELLSILNNFNQSSYGVLFESGYKVWKQNKFFGVGLKNFGKICDRDVISTNEIHQTCSNHPHNLYIQILSETGVVGLTIFLSLFLSFFISILKKINLVNKTSIKLYIFVPTFCYLIGFLWPIVTSGSFYSSWNGFFYWIVIGILINLTYKKSSLS